jgi:Uma2 family endonuclease
MAMVAEPVSRVNGQPPEAPPYPIWRLSVEQYHAMVRLGILTEDDPVELLEGYLVTKMSKNPPHRIATKLTRDALAAIMPIGWYVDSQEPVTTDDSEPEPDVSVIRGDTRQYRDRHPGADDVATAIEVSDCSLDDDRIHKKRIYAAARIPVYWVVNLVDRQVEVFSEPGIVAGKPDYEHCVIYSVGDSVPVVIDGREIGRIAVQDIMP